MQSTRSNYTVSDTAAVLQGIAPDGGLFVDPDVSSRPFDVAGSLQLPYTGMAEKIFSHLLPGFCGKVHDIASVYPGKFSSDKITPLTKVGESYALELYHGPTSAFKDVALSVLPLFITAAKEIEGIRQRQTDGTKHQDRQTDRRPVQYPGEQQPYLRRYNCFVCSA